MRVNACSVRIIRLCHASCLYRSIVTRLPLIIRIALETFSCILVIIHRLGHLLLHLNHSLGIEKAISEIQNVLAL